MGSSRAGSLIGSQSAADSGRATGNCSTGSPEQRVPQFCCRRRWRLGLKHAAEIRTAAKGGTRTKAAIARSRRRDAADRGRGSEGSAWRRLSAHCCRPGVTPPSRFVPSRRTVFDAGRSPPGAS
jgi:hypothetical protein